MEGPKSHVQVEPAKGWHRVACIVVATTKKGHQDYNIIVSGWRLLSVAPEALFSDIEMGGEFIDKNEFV